ncbi:MAG: nitroreductase family protein [Elusimicrobiota bacterium]|nr:MAG: nitroreductase family protein [Elusimicrobiota bacterium]
MRNLKAVEGRGAFANVVARRRATPAFRPDPVPDDLLQQALELGTFAPSGYNLQPWRFIVVRDPDAKRALRAAAFGQEKVEKAPVVIVACGDTAAWKDADLDRVIADGRSTGSIPDDKTASMIRRNVNAFLPKTDMGVWVTRQTMIAFSFLMLAAENLGLDTAPMEGFDEAMVRSTLGIPETARVIALLALGYADPPDKPFGGRFDLERVVYDGRWDTPWRSLSIDKETLLVNPRK